MISALSVCNMEKVEWHLKFQTLMASLFVIENIKYMYGFSLLDQKEHFGTKTIWLFQFFLFCLSAAANSMPSEQSRL